METVGLVLLVIGGIIGLVYGIIFLVRAFQTSIWWGLGSLLVPFVSIIFLIMHWDVAKKPFLMSLLSIPFVIGGMLLMPEMQTQMAQ